MSEGGAKKTSTTAPTVPHNCVTFDDGRGHKWHVPFDEVGSVPVLEKRFFSRTRPERTNAFGRQRRVSVCSASGTCKSDRNLCSRRQQIDVRASLRYDRNDSLMAEQPGSRRLVSCRSSGAQEFARFGPLRRERETPAP